MNKPIAIKYILIPGLHNSDAWHWQSIWQKSSPTEFFRVNQLNWDEPNCEVWVNQIEREVKKFKTENLIFIGHSVGCSAILKWQERFNRSIKGAFFVAPSDVDKKGFPDYISGFKPMITEKLPFKSLVVASTNDHVVSIERAKFFAQKWGSDFIELQEAGHIETKSGFGNWPEGLELLKRFE